MQRRSASEEWILRQKRRRGVENIILEVFVNLAVEEIGSGLGRGFDMGSAGRAHRRIVHGSRDVNLFDGFHRRRG